MLTRKDKENIIAAFQTIDVKEMELEHADERVTKWFRFGSYTGLSIAQEIIKQLPEKKPPKKKKELTKKVS